MRLPKLDADTTGEELLFYFFVPLVKPGSRLLVVCTAKYFYTLVLTFFPLFSCICFSESNPLCSPCRHHMEPEWAAVELLDCIDGELNPGRGAEQQQQQSSEATLSAIRVLPAPVAGDLFVTCAARGHIGVVLFYFEEGEQPTTFGAGLSCTVPLVLGFSSWSKRQLL